MKLPRNFLILNAPLILVELMTILLLVYIAYGEANRKFEEFHLGKMASQAEIIRNALDAHLQAGIPLEQFGGFNALSDALIQSDRYMEQIELTNLRREPIFTTRSGSGERPPLPFTPFERSSGGKGITYALSSQSYRVELPLAGKFGAVGGVVLEVSRAAVDQPIRVHFLTIGYWSGLILLLFTLLLQLVAIVAARLPRVEAARKNILNLTYLASFVAISTVIGLSVFQIYEQGARAKSEALTNAMAQRIGAILELGIDLNDIDGVNEAFIEYRHNNPEINGISLNRNGLSRFNIDPKMIGAPYQPLPESYEYRQPLSIATTDEQWELAVTIPVSIVKDAIMERVNEFLVLMLACGLISWIFLDAGTGLTQWLQNRSAPLNSEGSSNFQFGLKLVKPAYFLIVFTSALPVSFLPQLVTEIAKQSSSELATATLPFTIFYFVFAAVLVPAGRYAERGELKRMMAVGFVTELIGLLLIALSTDYWLLTIGRAFSGFAQGVFLIGLNSYTLSITPRERRTEGSAVKVNGRNAALISGTAIGALLYAYISYQMIFVIAVGISLVGILYLWKLVPSVDELKAISDVAKKRKPEKAITLKEDLLAVVRDGEFMKTLIFIGLIGKMAITGVIMFAIPLILSQKGIASEDIGQSVMLYYIASIIVTRFASQRVDATGASQSMLVVSALIGSLGMVLIGITGIRQWEFGSPFIGFDYLVTAILAFNHWLMQFDTIRVNEYLILLGIILAGISNGMMSAPIMTHIDKTPVAHQYGNKAVSATYLFLERGGHVVGPMVISFMLLFTYQTTLGIALFGVITLLFSLIFWLTSKQV